MTEKSEINSSVKVSVIIDDDKNTKLHYAAASGREEELLNELKIEPKVDNQNYLGWTPLMMACRNGQLSAVKILLGHHADATKKNRYGMSVFLISLSKGNLEIVTLILQHLLHGGVSRQSMQKLFSPLSMSILFGHDDILKYLIQQSFDLNITTPLTGVTPLMFAAAMENCTALDLLLSKGADATIKNCFGLTAQEIIDFRNQKMEGRHNNQVNPVANGPQVPPPQISLSPYIVTISPQPSFFQLPVNAVSNSNCLYNSLMRKSSNVSSPSLNYYCATPNVTPITPLNLVQPPQIFFPPDFSPSQYFSFSPMQNNFNQSDFLNARLNTSSVFMPSVSQPVNYPSPCE